jgi:hypothetical protein
VFEQSYDGNCVTTVCEGGVSRRVSSLPEPREESDTSTNVVRLRAARAAVDMVRDTASDTPELVVVHRGWAHVGQK